MLKRFLSSMLVLLIFSSQVHAHFSANGNQNNTSVINKKESSNHNSLKLIAEYEIDEEELEDEEDSESIVKSFHSENLYEFIAGFESDMHTTPHLKTPNFSIDIFIILHNMRL